MAATAASPDLAAARLRLREVGRLLDEENLASLYAERLALYKLLAAAGATHAELGELSGTSKDNVKWAIHQDRRAARAAANNGG